MSGLGFFSNLFAIYYFYYVSQTCVVLDKFCTCKRDEDLELYYALDWEKVNKNRCCCTKGWSSLQSILYVCLNKKVRCMFIYISLFFGLYRTFNHFIKNIIFIFLYSTLYSSTILSIHSKNRKQKMCKIFYTFIKFIENFNAKNIETKSVDSIRITHRANNRFRLFPYKNYLLRKKEL